MDAQNIPSLEDYYREEKTQENSTSCNNCPTEKLNMSKLNLSKLNLSKLDAASSDKSKCSNGGKGSVETFHNKQKKNDMPVVQISDREDWTVQETSNSEDSSLSDSDRTLVGDVPDETELDCESALFSSPYRHVLPNRNDDDECERFFKIVYLRDQKCK